MNDKRYFLLRDRAKRMTYARKSKTKRINMYLIDDTVHQLRVELRLPGNTCNIKK